MQTLITFALVSFAWIFFRAANLKTAIMLIQNSTHGLIEDLQKLLKHQINYVDYFGVSASGMYICLIEIFALQFILNLQNKRNLLGALNRFPVIVRWSVYLAFIFIILTFSFAGKTQFIYFQF
jgi:hypothetical protein